MTRSIVLLGPVIARRPLLTTSCMLSSIPVTRQSIHPHLLRPGPIRAYLVIRTPLGASILSTCCCSLPRLGDTMAGCITHQEDLGGGGGEGERDKEVERRRGERRRSINLINLLLLLAEAGRHYGWLHHPPGGSRRRRRGGGERQGSGKEKRRKEEEHQSYQPAAAPCRGWETLWLAASPTRRI